jgi:acetyl-CoA carboxylase, biotin carboxylase subunit
VPVFYDSLVGKLVAHARTRTEAVAVMRRALFEFEAAPLATTAPFLRQVMAEPAFVAGNYTLAFLPSLLPPDEEPDDL